jgi:glycosyltransferase involved in cell wall biosynthesis
MLIQSKELRSKLSDNAYEWVVQNRTWESIGKIVNQRYEKLIN